MKRFLLLFLVLLYGAASAQQLINCAPAIPCTSAGPVNTGTGDPAWQGGGKINANFIQLYGFFNGQLMVFPSGDTSGNTDLNTLKAAIATMAANTRLPPLAVQFYPSNRIVFGPGTFFFTSGNINLLGAANAQKIQGIWLQGSGRGVTSIDYNPSVSSPLFVNNRGLDVKITDVTFTGHDVNSDFMWSQELAGITNVQDYTFQDVEWSNNWNYIFRLTGGNNNSEWKFERATVAGSINSWVYVPPAVTTTMANGSSTVVATNTTSQVQVGDTGAFSSSVAPLVGGTQYYVVSANAGGFSVALTPGGIPVVFTTVGSSTFQTGSDQFLNFWFSKCKFDTGTSLGQWINMAFGGSIKIRDSDISGHAPASVAYIFNLLGQIHSGGVMDFEVDGLRIEHSNNNSRVMHSQWWRGSILWNNLDESSQAGLRTITNPYAFYEFLNTGGPTIEYRNSQLMGIHNYTVNVNNFNYQREVLYENVTLLDNPTFANFIITTNVAGNTGGAPLIECNHCRNYQVATTVGFSELVDTTLNWQFGNMGTLKTRSTSCLGANSDFPATAAGHFEIRLPLNAAIVQTRFWKPAGSGNTGAFQYTLQTTEGSPTVIAGGAATPMAGANAGTAIPLYTTYGAAGSTLATSTPFVMTTDAARTLNLVDSSGARAGPFTGVFCVIDYIG